VTKAGDAAPTADLEITPVPTAAVRSVLVRRALRLEYLTVGWNVVEGVVAVRAAVVAGSVALLGFGVDSFVESASGIVLVWRLLAEGKGRAADAAALDRRAHRLVAWSLFLLALYIGIDAVHALWTGERPRPSLVGIVLTTLSMAVMMWLARAKRAAAYGLKSRALEADAFQTTACWWLSVVTLVGVGLNASLGWWWADPLAALGMSVLITREAREAWKGEQCCD